VVRAHVPPPPKGARGWVATIAPPPCPPTRPGDPPEPPPPPPPPLSYRSGCGGRPPATWKSLCGCLPRGHARSPWTPPPEALKQCRAACHLRISVCVWDQAARAISFNRPPPPQGLCISGGRPATTKPPHCRDGTTLTIHRPHASRPSRAQIGGHEAREIPTVRLPVLHFRSRPTRRTMIACVGIGSRDANHLLCQPSSMDESSWSAVECGGRASWPKRSGLRHYLSEMIKIIPTHVAR